MALIPSGSQNIYVCTMTLLGPTLRPSIFTGHYAAIVPGTNDTPANALDAFHGAYGPFIDALCVSPLGTLEGSAEACAAALDPGTPIVGAIGTIPRSGPAGPLEAGFRIQRVGAAGTYIKKGRCRFGPCLDTIFTDPPRYRRIDISSPTISSLLTNLRSQAAPIFFGMQEVLFDRVTGVAVAVTSWNIPKYTSRVWQRAGYPQGVRGPDRS